MAIAYYSSLKSSPEQSNCHERHPCQSGRPPADRTPSPAPLPCWLRPLGHRRRRPARRGVLLLLMLSLLVLFAVVGVTYVLVSSQFRRSAAAPARLEQIRGRLPQSDSTKRPCRCFAVPAARCRCSRPTACSKTCMATTRFRAPSSPGQQSQPLSHHRRDRHHHLWGRQRVSARRNTSTQLVDLTLNNQHRHPRQPHV